MISFVSWKRSPILHLDFARSGKSAIVKMQKTVAPHAVFRYPVSSRTPGPRRCLPESIMNDADVVCCVRAADEMGRRCPWVLQHDLCRARLASRGNGIQPAVLPDLDLLRLVTDRTTTQMDQRDVCSALYLRDRAIFPDLIRAKTKNGQRFRWPFSNLDVANLSWPQHPDPISDS